MEEKKEKEVQEEELNTAGSWTDKRDYDMEEAAGKAPSEGGRGHQPKQKTSSSPAKVDV